MADNCWDSVLNVVSKRYCLFAACSRINDGGIPQNHKFRQHIPTLHNNIHAFGHMIPDGALATCYLAQLPNLDKLSSWSVDHRYHRETAIPLADLPGWKQAAQEIMQMLDQIVTDGI